MGRYILLFQCRDQKGIVAKISDFVFQSGGNIITADQHSTDPEAGFFFMRVEFHLDKDGLERQELEKGVSSIAREFGAEYQLYDKAKKLRMGILASRPDHCLIDLLYLWRALELPVNIPFVISNFSGHKELVEQFKVPFYFIEANKNDRKEAQILALAHDNTDFLVLARYMLVLSPDFLRDYAKDIINIHHGFLPSFKGINPYAQALQEGVKVIGATAHFVTEKLDCGPIIAQAVENISHKDGLESLIRKGRNLEKHALSSAVSSYLDYRIMRHEDKTIVF